MKMTRQATKGHLVVGVALVLFALASFLATLAFESVALRFMIFFFGVWGGVELGRYLEHHLSTPPESI